MAALGPSAIFASIVRQACEDEKKEHLRVRKNPASGGLSWAPAGPTNEQRAGETKHCWCCEF